VVLEILPKVKSLPYNVQFWSGRKVMISVCDPDSADIEDNGKQTSILRHDNYPQHIVSEDNIPLTPALINTTEFSSLFLPGCVRHFLRSKMALCPIEF
jgi:hypothetical protein